MRGTRFDSAAAIAVLPGDRLAGLTTIEKVFAAADGAIMRDVMDPEPSVVRPDTDQEQAA